MILDVGNADRKLHTIHNAYDLVVVGGGLSGVCAAVAAARNGLSVCLVQDRPVLGGNASSEVRLWILGATSHMGNNNRWAREGGLVDEILVENMYRNPEGNPLIFDTILLELVHQELNLTLLLNTAVFEVEKAQDDTIKSVKAFCSQNQRMYQLDAPLFVDASGDGILGFLAGAAFRMGAESATEFDEKFAPSKEYGEMLGHSLYFYSKDIGRPVKYVPPAYALEDITKIPRYKSFNTKDFGCRLWWIEYGGRLDTIDETEAIKWELWKVVYGVWNHIKNSGEFPEAENLTLEWVGAIPGKRESRRFEGDYILSQKDIVEQRTHDDAVAFGGWSIDLHPADGVFSEKPGCNQWHSKGLYQIPFRCMYSRNISNLFLAGRIISASHVAFGSTRVMATGALIGEVVGTAASMCRSKKCFPKGLLEKNSMYDFQQLLLSNGLYIPGIAKDPVDLVGKAVLNASSCFEFDGFSSDAAYLVLEHSVAQMVPLKAGTKSQCTITCNAEKETTLIVQLRESIHPHNHTPEVILEEQVFHLNPGENLCTILFSHPVMQDGYAYITFLKNSDVSLPYTHQRLTGVLTVFNSINKAVSNYGKQEPLHDIGVDAFEFWCPQRRPNGKNLAIKMKWDKDVFSVENIRSGVDRPTSQPNAWVADPSDNKPTITLLWENAVEIDSIELCLDSDFDHPMESVLMGHPENVMPFCIRHFKIEDEHGNILWEVKDNHQTRRVLKLNASVKTRLLSCTFFHPSAYAPAAVFAIRCYQND